MSQPQGHSAARRIMSMKNSSDTIGGWTCDLPASSTVPQPTALLRASNILSRKRNVKMTNSEFPLTLSMVFNLTAVNLKQVCAISLCAFSLLLQCKWDLYSSGMLCSIDWQFVSDILGQPIIPTFRPSTMLDPRWWDRQVVPQPW
jgi:hypothetical protein